MDYDAIRKAFDERMDSEFTDALVVYGDQSGPPDGSGDPWVRAKLVPSGAAHETITGDSDEGDLGKGFYVAQVFTEPGGGDGAGLRIATTIKSIFRMHDFLEEVGFDLRCQVPEVTAVGSDESGWNQHNVSVPWTYLN